jgi:superfamily II DNA or RNA helicase
MTDPWLGLQPETVSGSISFDASNPDSEYSRIEAPTMPSLQTEGVAYLCDLLARRRVALLADEVGMGKTLQALGVAAMLWRRRPSARILVMAPNRDICRHWENELAVFVDDHYRICISAE